MRPDRGRPSFETGATRPPQDEADVPGKSHMRSPCARRGAWPRVDPRATSAYGARLHDPPPHRLHDRRSRKGPDDMTDTHVGRREPTAGLAALGAAALAR